MTLLLSYNVMSCRNVRETKSGCVKYQSFLADRLIFSVSKSSAKAPPVLRKTNISVQFYQETAFFSYGVLSGGGSWKVTAQADVFEIFRDFRMRFWKPFWGFHYSPHGKKNMRMHHTLLYTCQADIFED